MSLLSGGGFVPFNLINDDMVMSALFGGITAAGTMLIAQRGEADNPDAGPDPLDRMEQRSLGAGEMTGIAAADKSRATESRA